MITLLRNEFRGYNRSLLQKDLLAGVNVAAVAVPLSLAFGLASGASGAAGLVTAILAGLIIGALSGTPSQVSGPTGAMAAVLLVVGSQHGLTGIWLTTVMAGAMMILIGVFKLGRIVLLIPRPVVNGFTSGIAILIFTGQLHNILGIPGPKALTALGRWIEYATRAQAGELVVNWQTVIITSIVILLMFFIPKKLAKRMPVALVGVVVATVVAQLFQFQIPAVGAIPPTIFLNEHFVPDFSNLGLIPELLLPAASVALLCCLQALLSGVVCVNLTGKPMDSNQELIGQGVANMLIPFFGGVPATGAVARTKVGIANGSQTRLTTIFHGLILLVLVMGVGPIIARIPIAALAGVLVVTTIRMNEWRDIRWMFKHRFKSAIGSFLITMLATASLDLTTAILMGMGLTSLIFISRLSNIDVTIKPIDLISMQARGHDLVAADPDSQVAYITGPMFFGSIATVRGAFNILPSNYLILSMRGVPAIDVSGLELIEELYERMSKQNGKLLFAGVQPSVKQMLDRAKITERIGENHFFWSADQAILLAHEKYNPLPQHGVI